MLIIGYHSSIMFLLIYDDFTSLKIDHSGAVKLGEPWTSKDWLCTHALLRLFAIELKNVQKMEQDGFPSGEKKDQSQGWNVRGALSPFVLLSPTTHQATHSMGSRKMGMGPLEKE